MLKKRKLNELEGKDVSAIDDEIGTANKDLEQQWEATRQELVSKYKLDDLSALSYDSDPHTMWKQWKHKLLLLVRQKNAAFDSNYVPSKKENNGEPLRQTAEKCLSNIVRSEIPVKILGNAPLSYVRREYPKKLQKILKTEKTGTVL
uniref:Uncharacterized protein n=1 Tax=Ditylenchus dipsaci TaxID=166011 RepID=A0A915DRK3_9BILA